MAPLASWNEFLAAYGVSQQTFCDIFMWEAAHILTDSTPHQAGTVIMALQQWGLSSSNINRSVLLRAPQILLLELQQLQAVHSFLQGQCGLPGSRIRDVVAAMPLLLLQDVERQLQPRVALLQQKLGADAHQLSSCLCKQPGLLMAAHASSLQPRLQLLRSFGFHGPDLLQLVCADPAVLTLSTSSLQRKWQFLTRQMGAGTLQLLQQCPTYFSKALVTEVAPRHGFVVQRGLQGRFTCQGHRQQQPPGFEAGGSLGQLLTAEPWGQHPQQQQPQQQQQQQQAEPQQSQPPCGQTGAAGDQQPAPPGQQLHLGKLLDPTIPEFLQMLGQADAADYEAYVQHWVQTEGLKWTAVRVT